MSKGRYIMAFRTEKDVIAQIKIGYNPIEQGMISSESDPTKLESGHKSKILINGYTVDKIQPTFANDWFIIPDSRKITSIQTVEQVDNSSKRKFVLKDPSSEVKGVIPAELSIDDVAPGEDDDGYECVEYGTWKAPKYKAYQALYRLHREPAAYYLKDLDLSELTYYDKGELKDADLTAPINEKYSVVSNRSSQERVDLDLSHIVKWSQLELMLTAPPAIGSRPCSISSLNTYRIIRAYVKDHMDLEQAAITSDYDFCFEVRKKYSVRPYTHTTEEKKANGKSYAKPRLNHRLVKNERSDVKFFEMTHDEKNYSGYTTIPGFSGESITDLINTIKMFLETLMLEMNRPLVQCDCCKGTGIEAIDPSNVHKAHKEMFPKPQK